MILQKGERVCINLDIDKYKEGEDVLFGTVIDQKMVDDDVKRKYISKPILTTVKGDDGKIYYSLQIDFKGVMGPNTFMNMEMFKDVLNMKLEEINKVLNVMKDLENVYMEAITNRFNAGMKIDKLKANYTTFLLSNLKELRDSNNSVAYLTNKYTSYFDPNFRPPKGGLPDNNNDNSKKDD